VCTNLHGPTLEIELRLLSLFKKEFIGLHWLIRVVDHVVVADTLVWNASLGIYKFKKQSSELIFVNFMSTSLNCDIRMRLGLFN
jgi:hypothetical protein